MGLKEFLAACGVRQPSSSARVLGADGGVHEPSPSSCSTGGCPLVLHEVASEGRRRIIFAACGVRGISCSIVLRNTMLHEVASEGRRRIIFAACGARGIAWSTVLRNTVT